MVSGLGLIGLLTAQLLAAQGCRVLGLDPDPAKCSLAQALGVEVLNLAKVSTQWLGPWSAPVAPVWMGS